MNINLNTLVLLCRQSEERINLATRLSFFHGEMSVGKSTIAKLLDYCFGGARVRTPACQAELVAVRLEAMVGDTNVLIERNQELASSVEVTWEGGGEMGRENIPLAAGAEPVIGEDLFTYSDFLLHQLGIPVLKVRGRKGDPESELHRVSFRDFFVFCYLEQRHLDSSFFFLEVPVRMEKSKDVLKYVLGFHSDRLNDLQIELSEKRQSQRTMREAAKQFDEFLKKYGFNSKDELEKEIDRLNDEEEAIVKEIEEQTDRELPAHTVAEEDRALIARLTDAIARKTEAVTEVAQRIKEQESLIAEFIAMKFKVARASTATKLLKGATFHSCPACGTDVAAKTDGINCILCKSDLATAPGSFETDSAVMERDLSERIDDLKRSIQRLKRSHDRQNTEVISMVDERKDVMTRVEAARKKSESEYMQRARQLEARRGGIRARRQLLVRIKGMPNEVEVKHREADALTADITRLERDIAKEQARFESGRENLRCLEKNFLKVLMASHFPSITAEDKVVINQRSWFPYVHPKGNASLAWTFEDASSGGKMVLFKICFALALHLTVAEKQLPLPRILIIDSPMKNITPDINPDIFRHFYGQLYRLLSNELKDWQCVVIDQTYFEPPEGFENHNHRLFTTERPLISYYHGH